MERAIRAKVETDRPEDAFFGEETGTSAEASRKWIIDPIDGTSNFLRGVPNWATLIALEINGAPRIGVVSMPALDTRWWAEIGSGAWKQVGDGKPTKIRVSGIQDLKHASLSFQSIEQWEDAGVLRLTPHVTASSLARQSVRRCLVIYGTGPRGFSRSLVNLMLSHTISQHTCQLCAKLAGDSPTFLVAAPLGMVLR